MAAHSSFKTVCCIVESWMVAAWVVEIQPGRPCADASVFAWQLNQICGAIQGTSSHVASTPGIATLWSSGRIFGNRPIAMDHSLSWAYTVQNSCSRSTLASVARIPFLTNFEHLIANKSISRAKKQFTYAYIDIDAELSSKLN